MTTATSTVTTVSGVVQPADRHRGLRRLLSAGLVVVFVGTCVATGLPTDRLVVLGWALAVLAVQGLGRGWAALVRLLADWVPLMALLMLYDVSRGMAVDLGVTVHVTEPAAVDRWLGDGVLPTVWLQEHWGASWWAATASLVYSSHFVVTPAVLAMLWLL
jgi:hypothetical protein